MKRFLILGSLVTTSCLGLVFLQACGGDTSVVGDGGGMDGTVQQDTGGGGMDTGTGMDTGMDMDGNMGMDGSMGGDGSMGMDGGGGGSNPGMVTCSQSLQGMLACDAGFTNACCVTYLNDGGQNYACLPQGQCMGDRWRCDETADCMQGDFCCITTFQNQVAKACNLFCGMGSVRACKSSTDCPDAGACNTYTCPGNVQIQACTKPQNCN